MIEGQVIDVAANLAAVEGEIAMACASAGRDPSEVTLIAVSKAQPNERIEAALAAGHRVFGENYVQESAARWPALRQRYPSASVHLIGPLQTNKVRRAVDLFDAIQSVDRLKLAREIARAFEQSGRTITLFCQVNTGEEPQKAGVWPADVDAFVAQCRSEFGLAFEGLMAIPPANEDIGLHALLLDKIGKRNGIRALSIGMSADYPKAVAFGATHVRVGSAIFGARSPKRV